jgi:hypothetical protein
MNCHDFQRKWNELLDREAGVVDNLGDAASTPNGTDRDPAVDEAEALLLSHAADCPACRPITLQYQALRLAIRAWRQPPVPSAELVQRILSSPAAMPPRAWQIPAIRVRRLWQDRKSRRLRLMMLAGFAATALLAWFISDGPRWKSRPDRQDRPNNVDQASDPDLHSITSPERAPDGSLTLHRALADATSATLDLARSASEPAARISRDMLDVTEQTGEGATQRPVASSSTNPASPNEGLVGLSVPLPLLDPLASETMTASRVLQQVGDQLSAGATPLSSTARHAFGFLLGPARAPAGSRAARSTPTGA